MSDSTTIKQNILSAAKLLTSQGLLTFTAEQLVVTSWQHNKKLLGLRGYEEEHPDNNKVLSYVMGERGLHNQGFLDKVRPKVYALTDKGKRTNGEVKQNIKEHNPSDTIDMMIVTKILDNPAYIRARSGIPNMAKMSDVQTFLNTYNTNGFVANIDKMLSDRVFIELTAKSGNNRQGSQKTGRTLSAKEWNEIKAAVETYKHLHRNRLS